MEAKTRGDISHSKYTLSCLLSVPMMHCWPLVHFYSLTDSYPSSWWFTWLPKRHWFSFTEKHKYHKQCYWTSHHFIAPTPGLSGSSVSAPSSGPLSRYSDMSVEGMTCVSRGQKPSTKVQETPLLLPGLRIPWPVPGTGTWLCMGRRPPASFSAVWALEPVQIIPSTGFERGERPRKPRSQEAGGLGPYEPMNFRTGELPGTTRTLDHNKRVISTWRANALKYLCTTFRASKTMK